DEERGDKTEHEPPRRRARHRRAEQRHVIERVLAGGAMMHPPQPEDGEQHEEAARLREEEELDGGVGAPLVAPDTDEEVHRHQHQLPEEIEEEQVEREEHSEHAHQAPHEVEVKEADALGDFVPRGEHRHDAEKQREQHQEQAHAVDGEMDADSELRDPRPVELLDPTDVTRHQRRQRHHQIEHEGDEAEPARAGAARTEGPGEEAAGERKQDDRREVHANSTRATMIAVPPARPIAYQRSLPFSLRDRAWLSPRAASAMPRSSTSPWSTRASQRYGRTTRRS